MHNLGVYEKLLQKTHSVEGVSKSSDLCDILGSNTVAFYGKAYQF